MNKKVCLILLPLFSSIVYADNLTVNVTSLNDGQGKIVSMLCTEDENFPNYCENAKTVDITGRLTSIEFKEVQAGTYAFAAFHDKNENTQIDFNNGTVCEGVSFSNNQMGQNSAPTFEVSSFELSGDRTIDVEMRYIFDC